MKIELEQWEINTALNALAELPYKESGAIIQRIKDQIDPPVTHCKGCAWFAPVESMPAALALHEKLHELFDGILPPREGRTGICRKVTFSPDKPVLCNENGFCHRAERKEENQ